MHFATLQRARKGLVALCGVFLLGYASFEFVVFQRFKYPRTSQDKKHGVVDRRPLEAFGPLSSRKNVTTKVLLRSVEETTKTEKSSSTISREAPTPLDHGLVVNKAGPAKMQAVVILASYRTGSSFVGQLFNQHRDAFYLFEPLFFSIWAGNQATSKVIKDLFLCNVSSMREENFLAWKRAKEMHEEDPNYKTLKNLRQMEKCVYKGLCFRGKSRAICTREMCRNSTAESCDHCAAPSSSLMREACAKAKVRVIKVIRVDDIETLKRSWSHPNIDLRVIHLVRDPRSTLLSRLRLVRSANNVGKLIRGTCERSFRIHKQYLSDEKRFDWLKGRYKLVRYEDIIDSPLRYANDLYDFVGFPGFEVSREVTQWMNKSTSATDFRFFGTNRDTNGQKYKWRQQIPMRLVEIVQRECKDMMALLGYKPALSKAHLWSLTEPLIV